MYCVEIITVKHKICLSDHVSRNISKQGPACSRVPRWKKKNGDGYLELRRVWGWTGGRLLAVATPARSELGGEESGGKFILENGLRGRNRDLLNLSGCSVFHTPRSFVFLLASANRYVFGCVLM